MSLPTIIDIEALGLGRGSYPIEIGFMTSEGQVGCTLIRLLSSWHHWSSEAEKLHGITRENLKQCGKEIDHVTEWLNQSLRGATVYSDGWGNDISWLGRLFDEAEKPQLFKLESILTLLTEEERERWSVVYDEVVASANLTRHRASTDARIVQETYARIKGLSRN